MDIKFSIIIPVYNVAPYLEQCLNSVVAQTYECWEAICIDDGSEDGSSEMLDQFAQRDIRIKVFHQANAGVSAARNKALLNVTGNWIGFLDADDLISPDWLSKVAGIIKNVADIQVVRNTYVRIVNAQEHIKPESGTGIPTAEIYCGAQALQWVWGTYWEEGYLWTSFFCRDIIQGVKFNELCPMKEDCLFAVEAASRSCKVVQTDIAGYGYRMRPGSAVTRKYTYPQYEVFCLEGLRLWHTHRRLFEKYDCSHVIAHVLLKAIIRHVLLARNALGNALPQENVKTMMRLLNVNNVANFRTLRKVWWPGWLFFKLTGSMRMMYVTAELAAKLRRSR